MSDEIMRPENAGNHEDVTPGAPGMEIWQQTYEPQKQPEIPQPAMQQPIMGAPAYGGMPLVNGSAFGMPPYPPGKNPQMAGGQNSGQVSYDPQMVNGQNPGQNPDGSQMVNGWNSGQSPFGSQDVKGYAGYPHVSGDVNYGQPVEKRYSTLSIVAFVVTLLTLCTMLLAVPGSIAGLVMGILDEYRDKNKIYKRGLARASIIISAIKLVFSVVLVFFIILEINDAHVEFVEDFFDFWFEILEEILSWLF